MIRSAIATIILGTTAQTALAHDFWIEPQSFAIEEPGDVVLDVFVGHGDDKTSWPVAPHRIIGLRSLGPDGYTTHVTGPDMLKAPTSLTLGSPGTHLVFIETTNSFSELPADRFDSYVADEGIRPIEIDRQLKRLNDKPGKELYSRRGKTLIEVGCEAGSSDVWQTEAGLTLEIIPRANPLTWQTGTPLPVEVRFHGAPVQGATMHVTNLEDETVSFTAKTGEDGRADIASDLGEGAWLVHTVWAEAAPNLLEGADYQTVFSSLTFDTRSQCQTD